MINEPTINLLDLEISIANAVDLISGDMANHHKRVAYISLAIAEVVGLPLAERHNLLLAALLHDLGALSLVERQRILQYDGDDYPIHAEVAYHLLKKFRHFGEVANIVRFHHVPWSHGAGQLHHGERVPLESHILHLADRIDALTERNRQVLSQATAITSLIARDAGERFAPALVEAFAELAWKEFFWLDVVSPTIDRELTRQGRNLNIELDWDDLQDFAELFAQVIDFRSRFTATHSSGVSAVAAMLADRMGFSETECQMMKVAGYLHDVGKLAIPSEILNKPGRLTETEYQVMKSHAYHTYRVLEPIAGLEEITSWAALHHERLSGDGYPGRLPGHKVPLGARVMAVADVFTAMSENRPYRQAASRDELSAELERCARQRQLDGEVVGVLLERFDDFDRHRERAQQHAADDYQAFVRVVNRLPG